MATRLGESLGVPGMPVPLRNISSKYIQAYEKLGTHIDAITTQNEPLHSQAGYSMMYMSDESARLVQNYVGPALVQAGLNTDIWAYDHNTGMHSISRIFEGPFHFRTDRCQRCHPTLRTSSTGLASTSTP